MDYPRLAPSGWIDRILLILFSGTHCCCRCHKSIEIISAFAFDQNLISFVEDQQRASERGVVLVAMVAVAAAAAVVVVVVIVIVVVMVVTVVVMNEMNGE